MQKHTRLLAFTFQIKSGPVYRNVERCRSFTGASVWYSAGGSATVREAEPSRRRVKAPRVRGISVRQETGSVSFRVQCAWIQRRVLASFGDLSNQQPRWVDERQPEWCSPLQQLSATEQKSAPQALYSNSRREGWTKIGGCWWLGVRNEGEGDDVWVCVRVLGGGEPLVLRLI